MSERKIEFGTTFRAQTNIAESAKHIEDLGFDIVGCGEHVTFHGNTANAFISLSVAAGVTKRVKLLSAITLVPLYPAALLAKPSSRSPARRATRILVYRTAARESAPCGSNATSRPAGLAMSHASRTRPNRQVAPPLHLTPSDPPTVQPPFSDSSSAPLH